MTAKALKTMSVARALTSVLREKYDDFKTSDKSNFTSVRAAYTPHEKNKQTYGVSGGMLLPQHCRISYALEQLHHSVAQNASSVSRLFFTRAAARPMFTNPSDTGESINTARADKPYVRESGQLEQNLEHQRQEVAMKLQVFERYLKKPVRNNQQNTLSKKDVVNFLEIVGNETAIGLALALSGQSVISDEKRSSVTKAATNACQNYLSSKQVSEMLDRVASKLRGTQLTSVDFLGIFSLALTKFAIKRTVDKSINEIEVTQLLTKPLDDRTAEDFLNENVCKELLHLSVTTVICSLVKHDETTSKLSSNETPKEIFQVFIELGEEISRTTLSVCSTRFQLDEATTEKIRKAIQWGVNIAKKAFVMWLTHFVPGQEDEKFLVDLIDLGADIAGKILSMLKDKFELDKETVQTLQDVIQLVSGLFISLVGTYVVCRQNSVC